MPVEGSMRHRTFMRWIVLLVIGLLYIASVPWYRDPGGDESLRIWWGLPDWVTVALGCYVSIAVLNCVAWLLTDVPDAMPETKTRDAASPRNPAR